MVLASSTLRFVQVLEHCKEFQYSNVTARLDTYYQERQYKSKPHPEKHRFPENFSKQTTSQNMFICGLQ